MPPHTQVIDTLEGLDQIAVAWEGLASKSGSPMQRYAWAKAFAEAFGSDYDLRVVVIRSGPEVSAIAPLVRRRGKLACLELLGVGELFEPADFVYSDLEALERLAAALVGLKLPLLLERIVATSPTVEGLRRAYRRRALVNVRRLIPYPWIPLDDGWKDPEQKFSSDRRSDIRRARRRAEKLGELSTEILSPRKHELGPLLDETFRVEAAGWKGRERTALAEDARRGDFFTRYAEGAAEAGVLRLAFLRIGGRAAAVQLAAECGGRFWLLKVGYDEEFKRSSPGTLLMLETVRHAAERGHSSYELLGSAEPWTRMWTDEVRECVALRAYPLRPGGLARVVADVARYARPGRGAS